MVTAMPASANSFASSSSRGSTSASDGVIGTGAWRLVAGIRSYLGVKGWAVNWPGGTRLGLGGMVPAVVVQDRRHRTTTTGVLGRPRTTEQIPMGSLDVDGQVPDVDVGEQVGQRVGRYGGHREERRGRRRVPDRPVGPQR